MIINMCTPEQCTTWGISVTYSEILFAQQSCPGLQVFLGVEVYLVLVIFSSSPLLLIPFEHPTQFRIPTLELSLSLVMIVIMIVLLMLKFH